MVRTNENSLSLDVLRQIKREDLKIRILIIIISGALLIVTNFLWFIQWNSPPKEKEEITFELEDEEDNDPLQSINTKSE